MSTDKAKGSSILTIGRDREGHWTLCENHGRVGGIFVSREAALDYAEDACGLIPGASVRFARRPVRSLVRMPVGKAA